VPSFGIILFKLLIKNMLGFKKILIKRNSLVIYDQREQKGLKNS